MIVGLLGNPGRGKTLSLTFLMYYLKAHTKIDKIVTNYMTDITTDMVESPQELEETTKHFKEYGIVALYGLDELWAWMDSRESQDNQLMTNIILNSRKRGAIIGYTTQSIGQVDKRLRENTDFLGFCNHYDAHETDYGHDVVVVELYYNNEMDEWVKVRELVIDASEYYGTYDTWEEIATTKERDEVEGVIQDVKEKFKSEVFKSKKDAVAFLTQNKGFSVAKADRTATNAVLELREEGLDV